LLDHSNAQVCLKPQGASLRELKEFFEANPKAKNYAGLRRIGDPNDGAAIWTKVADEDLEAKLAERLKERLAEEEVRREEIEATLVAGTVTERASSVASHTSSQEELATTLNSQDVEGQKKSGKGCCTVV
jgi:nitrogen regulatory protein PII-like uncharacterized protein